MKIILLIDDDVDDHDTITQAFYAIDKSAHCLCYSDCGEAISHLSSHTIPHIQCVLIDVHMLRMTGLECLKALRKIPAIASVDLIMISSQFREDDLDDFCRHGAKALCVKPSSWAGYQAMAEMILSDKVQAGRIMSV